MSNGHMDVAVCLQKVDGHLSPDTVCSRSIVADSVTSLDTYIENGDSLSAAATLYVSIVSLPAALT
jgi:hypothetical protein